MRSFASDVRIKIGEIEFDSYRAHQQFKGNNKKRTLFCRSTIPVRPAKGPLRRALAGHAARNDVVASRVPHQGRHELLQCLRPAQKWAGRRIQRASRLPESQGPAACLVGQAEEDVAGEKRQFKPNAAILPASHTLIERQKTFERSSSSLFSDALLMIRGSVRGIPMRLRKFVACLRNNSKRVSVHRCVGREASMHFTVHSFAPSLTGDM